jgi:hypothetical protein
VQIVAKLGTACQVWGKGKGKVYTRTGHEGPKGEQRYSTLSLTLAIEGVVSQRHAPGALPPEMSRYPVYRRLGGPQGRSEQVQKISPTPEFDPRTIQAVATCYTNYAIKCGVLTSFSCITNHDCNHTVCIVTNFVLTFPLCDSVLVLLKYSKLLIFKINIHGSVHRNNILI